MDHSTDQMSTAKVDLEDADNKDLVERIITRLMDQKEPEVNHVLIQLFPSARTMTLKAVAEDFANKRSGVYNDFFDLVKDTQVNNDIFRALSSADKNPQLIMARKTHDPTRFTLTLTCHRTPFKEFFAECRDITCEDCVSGRITSFMTDNQLSTKPWELKLDRVEDRRIDLCKNCGNLLTSKAKINLQNERVLYECDNCGHKGWTRAK
ncbi:MAG: hypothetical protein IH840_00535 [Candidatus Heimdallarchaeota archaeon]|nr:hypothetical protein [Candidatus Heimdallarchaeota archaeon]